MQVYALEQNCLLSAHSAEKGRDYLCPECKTPVRLKSGPHRSSHFFHLNQALSCRQAHKGPIHLRLQRYIQYLFDKEAQMERYFPEINRFADVACSQIKHIYEIQYSPMTLEEAQARCQDYESLGYQIIWILHDHTYNRGGMKPVEQFLRTKNCYYTNMDEEGLGMIYDELPLYGKRSINLRLWRSLPVFPWPEPLLARGATVSLTCEGDFFDLALKRTFPAAPSHLPFWESLKENYWDFFHELLRRSCK